MVNRQHEIRELEAFFMLEQNLAAMDGGQLSKHLKTLVSSDFVMEYVPFGLNRKETQYKLTNPFCLFYLKFVSGRSDLDESFWQHGILITTLELAYDEYSGNSPPSWSQGHGRPGRRRC